MSQICIAECNKRFAAKKRKASFVIALLHVLQKAAGPDQRATPASRLSAFEYRYLTEFQSHEPEFDYLKSLEIEEKINKVKWCRTSCGSRMLLSTNDKTIKLWRVCIQYTDNLALISV